MAYGQVYNAIVPKKKTDKKKKKQSESLTGMMMYCLTEMKKNCWPHWKNKTYDPQNIIHQFLYQFSNASSLNGPRYKK